MPPDVMPKNRCLRALALLDAQRAGQEACRAGLPLATFHFADDEEHEAFTESYKATRVLLRQTEPRRAGWFEWFLTWFLRG